MTSSYVAESAPFTSKQRDDSHTSSRSLAAAHLRLLESLEETSGVRAGERLDPVGLALFEGIARHGAARAQELDFLLHLVVPAVLVEFADVEEHAHFRDGVELHRARLPHVAGERGHREEVLGI